MIHSQVPTTAPITRGTWSSREIFSTTNGLAQETEKQSLPRDLFQHREDQLPLQPSPDVPNSPTSSRRPSGGTGTHGLPVLGSTSAGKCGGGFPGVKCSLLYVIRGVRGWTWWGCCTTGTLFDCGGEENRERHHQAGSLAAQAHGFPATLAHLVS